MADKKCSKCKHEAYDRYFSKCRRTLKEHNIKGDVYYTMEDCDTERKYVPYFARLFIRTCGEEGRYWEPQETVEKFDPAAK